MGFLFYIDKESSEWLNNALEPETVNYVLTELKKTVQNNWENNDLEPVILTQTKPGGSIDAMFALKKFTIESSEKGFIKKIVYAFDGVIG